MVALGTEVMGVPPKLSVPWAGSEVTRIAPSVSPLSTSENVKSVAANVLSVFFGMVTEPPMDVGASLTAVTVIVTVATAESTVPSLTLKVKLSAPL